MGLIRNLVEGPLSFQEEALSVWDVKENGMAILSLQLLDVIIQVIPATPFANNPEFQDSSAWVFSNNGSFSLKAAYVMAKGLNPLNLCTSPISWVWKIKSNPRIIFFFRLVSHNSIPTCEVLGSRGFTLDSYYSLCMECFESIIHVLHDCKYAKLFWTKLGVPHPLLNSFSSPLLDWLKANAVNSFSSNHLGVPWEVLFPMGIWHLWLQRNSFIFISGLVEPNLIGTCVKKGAKFFAIGLGSKSKPNKIVVQVAWKRPLMGWVTLSTDGLAMEILAKLDVVAFFITVRENG